jgi:mono/diheme cytochrome c family protein
MRQTMNHSVKIRPGALLIALWLMAAAGARTAVAGEGTELFNKICASCHSKDGTAQTPAAKKLGVKDLSQSKLTDDQISYQIREGRQENQTVSKMPAFKDKLSSDEVKSLIAVVKTFRK